MMRALLFGLRGPQLFNHSEGQMLGAMLPPLAQLNATPPPQKKTKQHSAVSQGPLPNYI